MADEKKEPALDDAPDTPGGEKPEKVEDRPMVGNGRARRLSRDAQGRLSTRRSAQMQSARAVSSPGALA